MVSLAKATDHNYNIVIMLLIPVLEPTHIFIISINFLIDEEILIKCCFIVHLNITIIAVFSR